MQLRISWTENGRHWNMGRNKNSRRLTPYDTGLLRMIESITEKAPKVRYFVWGFYVVASVKLDEEERERLIRAVAGRCGKRLIDVVGRGRDKVCFAIEYSNEIHPVEITGCPGEEFGNVYCHRLMEVYALKVEKYNEKRLEAFVGGGVMRLCEMGETVFTFLQNGISVDAPEHSYIICDDGYFFVETAENFEREWELK